MYSEIQLEKRLRYRAYSFLDTTKQQFALTDWGIEFTYEKQRPRSIGSIVQNICDSDFRVSLRYDCFKGLLWRWICDRINYLEHSTREDAKNVLKNYLKFWLDNHHKEQTFEYIKFRGEGTYTFRTECGTEIGFKVTEIGDTPEDENCRLEWSYGKNADFEPLGDNAENFDDVEHTMFVKCYSVWCLNLYRDWKHPQSAETALELTTPSVSRG